MPKRGEWSAKIRIIMRNYTIQFRYNGKEYSYPFQSSEVLKPTMPSLSLLLAAEDAAKDVLITYNLMVEGGKLSSIRVYGKGGELIVDVDELQKEVTNQ